MELERALVWFRRDLRDDDHAALAHALSAAQAVYCVFVFDTEILDALPTRRDRRVAFIHASLLELDRALARRGGGLIVRSGRARDVIPDIAARLGVETVFANRDYEPDAKARDTAVEAALQARGIAFVAGKDQVVFERTEVITRAGRPFSVYTPYRNAWRRALTPPDLAPHTAAPKAGRLRVPAENPAVPTLEDIGFQSVDCGGAPAGMSGARRTLRRFLARLDAYAADRDFPARDGTSRLSVHLRFGTVSIRALASLAVDRSGTNPGADKWLDELIWRDFYAQHLDRNPRIVTEPFRREYRAVRWREDEAGFLAWCEGRTGYPLVDAGMRELVATGFMHNRVRMVTASFLTKQLLVDWRLGERFFARHLIDYDLASNNGGWQWAASVGCDAQPWFRIFNPVLQSRRFDPEGDYIRRHVPELEAVPAKAVHAPWEMSAEEQARLGVMIGRHYPRPIVEHAAARERALETFGRVRSAPSGDG